MTDPSSFRTVQYTVLILIRFPQTFNSLHVWPTVTPLFSSLQNRLRTVPSSSDAGPSGDVPIAILMHKIHAATDYWEKMKLEQELMAQLVVYIIVCVCVFAFTNYYYCDLSYMPVNVNLL